MRCVALALALWARSAADAPPHLLLIVSDQLRRDAVSAFSPSTRGPDGPLTPNIDSIARDGVRFTAAYSSTPTCTPARLAMLTGRSPWFHGMLGYKAAIPRALPPSFVRMAEALGTSGFATAAFGKLHYSGIAHGFEHVDLFDGLGGLCAPDTTATSGANATPPTGGGFGAWFVERAAALGVNATPRAPVLGVNATPRARESGRRTTIDVRSHHRVKRQRNASRIDCTGFSRTGLGWNTWRAAPWPYPEALHPSAFVSDRLEAFVSARRDARPLFAKASFHRPHSPYDPPRRLWDLFTNKASALPIRPIIGQGNRWDELVWPTREGGLRNNENEPWGGNVSTAEMTATRLAYFASVRFVDEQVGAILSSWRRHVDSELSHTLVLFTADHGDALGDHLLWRKGYPLDVTARVPLVLRWPHTFERHVVPRGGEVSAPVELRDILPTLLDATLGAAPRARAPLRIASPRSSGEADVERETPLLRMDGRSMLELLRRAPSPRRALAPSRAASTLASAPVLELGEPSPPWREWIGLEHDQVYAQRNHWSALTDGATKYVFIAPTATEQLFDLAHDPFETCDLALGLNQSEARQCAEATPGGLARAAETLAMWRQRLVEQFQSEDRGARYVHSESLVARSGHDPPSPHFPGLSPARWGRRNRSATSKA